MMGKKYGFIKITSILVIVCFVASCGPLNYFRSPDMFKVRRIAVLNFKESPDNKKKGGGVAISEGIVARLSMLGKFAVIEGTQKEELLKQQSFELSGIVDTSTVKEIGKILGVDAIVLGHVP